MKDYTDRAREGVEGLHSSERDVVEGILQIRQVMWLKDYRDRTRDAIERSHG